MRITRFVSIPDQGAGLGREVNCRRKRSLAIDDFNPRFRASRASMVRWTSCVKSPRAAQRQDRNVAAERQAIQKLVEPHFGFVQQRSIDPLVAHAQTVIDEQNCVHRLVGIVVPR